ncbi:MAG: N-acetyltransferase [Oscillospiraceae bacterium]|nr:N-acetyltransferase [Oscillospiraceae bacterium]
MIRLAREADVPAMLAIYAPYVTDTTITFEYEVPAQQAFLERFRKITVEFPWLVWEEEGQILGYAYACHPFERQAYAWCAEPSIYLSPQAQGRGIGRRLYLALEELLKLLGYRMLLALITGENTRSLAFHQKLGYRFAGELKTSGYKFGRWLSVFWLEKQLQIVENPIDFPTKWGGFGQDNQKICDILYNLSLS